MRCFSLDNILINLRRVALNNIWRTVISGCVNHGQIMNDVISVLHGETNVTTCIFVSYFFL